MPEDETHEPVETTPASQPAQKVMKLSDQLFWNGNRQTVHSLNVIPRDTTLITEGDKRTIVLPGRLRDAFMAPPYVMALVKAIEKNPGDFGARNIAMICDALLSFVHNEGPGASTKYSAEFAEPRGRLEYMFEFKYFLSTTAADIINSLGIELKAFGLKQGFNVGIPEMKQFAGDNELYGGFIGRISKEDASFYVPHGLELAVGNNVLSQGWDIHSTTSLERLAQGIYVLRYNGRLYLAHHWYKNDIGHYDPIKEIHHGHKETIYLIGEGPYIYNAELTVDSDNIKIKNFGHDPFLVHLTTGGSFALDQIKRKIDRRLEVDFSWVIFF